MRKKIPFLCFALFFAFCLSACQVNGVLGQPLPEEEASVEKEPGITESLTLETHHVPLQPSEYYQYGTLSAEAQTVYDRTVSAASAGVTVVDLSDLSFPKEETEALIQKVLCDNPQLFFLSKSVSYSYDAVSDTVLSFRLSYTDGETVDLYQDGERTQTADRGKIEEQIRQFKGAAQAVLDSIPAEASPLVKERMIHDYILAHTQYDSQAAAGDYRESELIPRAFDAYGALCEGKATCEGYSKLFQYLCYCVGINATQVSGVADGGPHMWNALCLDGTWTLIDVTWDDPEGLTVDVAVYDYFNLTAEQMNQNHIPNTEVLSVPECTSESYAFYRNFAMYLVDTMGTPVNYETILEQAAWNKEEYLMFYTGNLSGDLQAYISSQFYSETSLINLYIAERSLPLLFGETYVTCGNYVYIPLE